MTKSIQIARTPACCSVEQATELNRFDAFRGWLAKVELREGDEVIDRGERGRVFRGVNPEGNFRIETAGGYQTSAFEHLVLMPTLTDLVDFLKSRGFEKLEYYSASGQYCSVATNSSGKHVSGKGGNILEATYDCVLDVLSHNL